MTLARTVPPGRWRRRLAERHWEDQPGPRSRWIDAVAAIYGIVTLALLVGAVAETVRGRLDSLGFFVPWAAYAGALTWASSRTRPRAGLRVFWPIALVVAIHPLVGAVASLDASFAALGVPIGWGGQSLILALIAVWIGGVFGWGLHATTHGGRPFLWITLLGVPWSALWLGWAMATVFR